ncbi:MAG TPA: hypothetical protein VLM89_16305 [Phycisphaerae bacterium]|nr:hypothetical protein [Phycisphaerae bacterium]
MSLRTSPQQTLATCADVVPREPSSAAVHRKTRRILWAAWSNEPLTETIERNLAAALAENGGQLLRVVEGRRPADDGIPTIDLQDALPADSRRVAPPPALPGDFGRIVADTHAFEHIEGSTISLPAVESRLRRCAAHANVILDRFEPDAVLVWNGLLSQRAVIAALARQRGIPVYYCERGMFPGSWYADTRGINAIGSLVRPPLATGLAEALVTALAAERRQDIIDRLAETARAGASAWGQPPLKGPDAWRAQLDIPAEARVLFFPLQVSADTNMQFFSPHFADSVAALDAVADALAGADDWFLLVKPHPKGTYAPGEVERLTARARNGRVVADINLHDALALATLVATINSNVAAEAVWSGRPVLQLGRGVLSGKSIVSEYTHDRSMIGQIEQAVAAWTDNPGHYERGLRFYDYLHCNFLLDGRNPDDARRLVERIQRTIAPRPPSAHQDGDPTLLARNFTWQPAVELFDRIARRSAIRNVVLVGFGQNALRLMLAVPLHPGARNLYWTAWDDNENTRQIAAAHGLPLADPWTQRVPTDNTLLIVTPREAADIGRRLQQQGYAPQRDWLYLIPPN